MLKQIGFIFILFCYGSQVFSAMSCKDIFASSAKQQPRDAFDLESKIRAFAQQELAALTEEEVFALRAEARIQEKALQRIETLNTVYKKMNGSERSHLAIVADHEVRKLKNKLKVGAVDPVYEALKTDFVSYEVNYIYLKTLKQEIEYLKLNQSEKTELIASKLKEVEQAEIFLGRHFYRYAAIRHMLNELMDSIQPQHAQYAKEVFKKLQDSAKIQATKQILTYKKIKLSEIEDYIDFSFVSKKALEKQVALSEFWMMVKRLTLSGPIVKFVKSIVYRLPQKIKLFHFAEMPLRTAISEMIGIGYHQHLRDVYLEKIEDLLKLNGQTEDQVRLLKSLNSVSENKDELLVLFARVPENEKIWQDMMAQARLMATENPMAQDFYVRMQAAEKKAISQGEFPLYYSEAGANVFGKLSVGGIVSYYSINAYLSQNPDQVQSATSFVQSFLKMIGQ